MLKGPGLGGEPSAEITCERKVDENLPEENKKGEPLLVSLSNLFAFPAAACLCTKTFYKIDEIYKLTCTCCIRTIVGF